MSLRQAIRSRFKSLEREHRDTDIPPKRKDSLETPDLPLCQQQNGAEKDSISVSPMGSPVSPRPPDSASSDPDSLDINKSLYELQLTQLQEQLVAAMIENQGLADELEDIKSRHKVNRLERDLELERHRAQDLERRLDSHAAANAGKPSCGLGADWVDVAHEVQEEDILTATSSSNTARTWKQRMINWLLSYFYEVVQDFTEEPQPEKKEEQEEDQLAVKKLKENIKRFKSGTKPIYTSIKGVHSVLQWKYPAFTLMAFIVYMYSVWHGWLLPVFLFLLIFRLFINYLRHKGWNINIKYFSDYDEEDKSKESENFKELGMSDKFNLVLQVARKVQNGLGAIADSLEKIKNLLTWKQPEATGQLFFMLCAGFVASCLLPGETLFFLGGLYMGIKWFIIEYIYHRFPRIKTKYDSVHKIWQTLPTDAHLEKRYHQAAINRNVLPSTEASLLGEGDVVAISASSSSSRLSEDDVAFCQLFNLPLTELPLPGWEGGRRCTLINKEKPLSSAFKHGKLYLTNSFMCFERYKSPSPKNLMLPLTDITNILKAKPYSWMPGGGMSMEVFVTGYERPYIFGAILSRDEVYDSIMAHANKAELTWALQKQLSEEKVTSSSGGGTERKDSDAETLSTGSQPSSPRASPGRIRMSDLKDDKDD